MSHEISEICRRLLEEHRERLNARFCQRKQEGLKLDAAAWAVHLRSRILPLVDRVAAVLPERAPATLLELYDVALDLFSSGHFAETTGILPQALAQLWDELLPLLTPLVARDPRRVAGSLSNAVLAIAQRQPKSVDPWLNRLQASGPQAETVQQLLQLGQASAWLAGLPEYRQAAIPLLDNLPIGLVQGLLGVDAGVNERQVRQQVARWIQDGWARMSWEPKLSSGPLELVGRCGAFVGWGGSFLFPPQVFLDDGQLCVSDTRQVWQILADRFGSSLHRCELSPKVAKRKPARGWPQIDLDGRVTWQAEGQLFPPLAQPTSQACDGRTLAVTLNNSFHVYLIARPTWAASDE